MDDQKHLNHKQTLPAFNRCKGQVEAIGRMIEEKRYCVDIITQIRAASSALRAIEQTILEKHIRSCLVETWTSKDRDAQEDKLQELLALTRKYKS